MKWYTFTSVKMVHFYFVDNRGGHRRVHALVHLIPIVSAAERGPLLERGLAALEEIEDAYQCLLASKALLPHLSEEGQSALLRDMLSSISKIENAHQRLLASKALLPYVPRGKRALLLKEIQAGLPDIEDTYERTCLMADLAPHLPEDARESLLREILSAVVSPIVRKPTKVRRVLRPVAPYLSARLLEEVIADICTTYTPSWQVEFLTSLAWGLAEEEQDYVFREALAVAGSIEDLHRRAQILKRLLWSACIVMPSEEALNEALGLVLTLAVAMPVSGEEFRDVLSTLLEYYQLTEDQIARISPVIPAQVVGDSDERERTLATLAVQMAEMGHVENARSLLHSIEDNKHRVRVLAALAPRWPKADEREQLFRQALNGIESEVQVEALATLAPYLPDSLLQHALSFAQGLDYDEARIEALTALAPRLPAALLEEIMVETWLWDWQGVFWAKLAPHLPEEKRERFYIRALERARRGDFSSWEAKTIVALAPSLPSHLMKDALEAVQNIRSPEYQSKALVALTPFLPKCLLLETLELAQQEALQIHYARALEALMPRMAEAGYADEALKAARGVEMGGLRPIVLVAGALGLPEEQQETVLEEALAIVEEQGASIGVFPRWSRLLASMGPHVAALGRPELALDMIRRIENPKLQEEAFINLTPHLQSELLGDALPLACGLGAKALAAFGESLLRAPRARRRTLWPGLLHDLATNTRQRLLSDLRALAPVIADMGGAQALDDAFHAIQDVGRWWP